MRRILNFAIIAMIIAPFSLSAGEKLVISYEDLPRLINSQNRRVMAGKALIDAHQARTGHLRRSFLPKVQAYGGGEFFQTGDFETKKEPIAGVEGKINLFRGGRDRLEEKTRKSQTDSAEATLEKQTRAELLKARNLFVEVLFWKKRIGDLKEAISLSRQTAGRVRNRIGAGLATETDFLEFEMSGRQLEQELALAKEDHEHALDALRILLNAPDAELSVRGVLSHTHDSDLESAGLDASEHPEIRELANQKEISESKKSQSNRWWTPSVDVYGGYALYPFRERERPTLGGRDEAVVGGRVTFELFDGLNGSSDASEQRHRAAAYAQEAEQRREELGGSYRKLTHELAVRHQTIHSMERNLETGRRYYSLSTEEYERGVKDSRDMMAALERFLHQRENHSRALRDYLAVKSELMSLLGK